MVGVVRYIRYKEVTMKRTLSPWWKRVGRGICFDPTKFDKETPMEYVIREVLDELISYLPNSRLIQIKLYGQLVLSVGFTWLNGAPSFLRKGRENYALRDRTGVTEVYPISCCSRRG